MAEDGKLFQRLWKGYFDAMTIRERINPRLQRQMMPKRYWRFLTEKTIEKARKDDLYLSETAV